MSAKKALACVGIAGGAGFVGICIVLAIMYSIYLMYILAVFAGIAAIRFGVMPIYSTLEDIRIKREEHEFNKARPYMLIHANENGAYPLAIDQDGQLIQYIQPASRQIVEASRYVEQVTTGAQEQKQLPAPATKKLKVPAIPAPHDLPAGYDLLDIVKRFNIDGDNIFLGKADGGEMLFIDAYKGLCHGVFNAVTGRGKTIIERGIEAQLLASDFEIIHMDLKFSLVDENGLDYRPLAQSLFQLGNIEIEKNVYLPHLVTDVSQIYAMLQWVAKVEIPRRLKLYQSGNHTYTTLFLFVEELLYLIGAYPEIAGFIGDVIVVGRSLGIKLFTAAQNFQSQNTGISGGMRENFESAFYLGGDDYSGAKLLDVRMRDLIDFVQEHNIQLGKGVTLLRNNTVAPVARLTRTGMASNEAIYYLLGKADSFSLPETDPAISAILSENTDGAIGTRRQSGKLLLSDRSGLSGGLSPIPIKSVQNRLTEPVGRVPDESPELGTDDKELPSEQWQELLTRYAKTPNIKSCLRQMNGGQGLSNRYSKHAKWIVETYSQPVQVAK